MLCCDSLLLQYCSVSHPGITQTRCCHWQRKLSSPHSPPQTWRFLDTDNHAAVLWQPVSKVTCVCVCVCLNTSKGVFDGKMIEGMEHGKRHAVLVAVILRGVWWSWCVCEQLVFLSVFNSDPSTPSRPLPAPLLLLLLTSPCPRAQHNTSTGVQTAAL